MISSAYAANSAPFASLIDVNFILINRIFVLAVTLLFFTSILFIRRARSQEIHPRIMSPIKYAIFGSLLLYAELAMSDMPSYQGILQGVQTIIVLICLAKLVNYITIDVYMRIRAQREAPTFVRDTVRLIVYLIVGIISLRLVFKIDLSAIVTTTTVITATIAFAMQSTLANALSGFSIQTDTLLARQNWISIKEKNIFGEIVNVGFRYTTLRNLENYLILVPNSVIMQNIITFHGNRESDNKPAIQVDVMLGYDMPPETAKILLMQAVSDDSEVLGIPEPVVRLISLNDSGITYQLKFWIEDPSGRIRVQDAIYSRVWYAVNRAGYSFPFPHRQIITSEAKQPFEFFRGQIAEELRRSELFALLDDATIIALAEQAPVMVFGPGEVVVHQGDGGSSLFIVLKGALDVSVDDAIVGSIQEGSFFGEMSLLTGEPRSATVRASNEVWLAEVTKESLEPILTSNPSILEKLSHILAEREARTRVSQETSADSARSSLCREDYLQRLKLFFRL
ncbi:MAG: mechanosensitive ion channel family protein [Desulfuromonadaceae bacterium]|nr:mechanosensitive ion channel family protein [Desulfuromonadaceae bacterium]